MSETKRTQINIRLSDTELEKVKLSAEVLGLSVGKYAKQVLLKSKLVKPQLPAQSQQVMLLGRLVKRLFESFNRSPRLT